MGLTKQEIAQKVDEKSCYTETEDIYGEIYGNMDTIGDDEVYVIISTLVTSRVLCVCLSVCLSVCLCVHICM